MVTDYPGPEACQIMCLEEEEEEIEQEENPVWRHLKALKDQVKSSLSGKQTATQLKVSYVHVKWTRGEF